MPVVQAAVRRDPRATKRRVRKRVDDLLRGYYDALKQRALHDREALIEWLQKVYTR